MKLKEICLVVFSFLILFEKANGATFTERCSDPNVVFCFGFDDLAVTEKGFYKAHEPEKCSDGVCKSIDEQVKVSGVGSLRMEIPSNTYANTSGGWRSNFSDDYSIQFGEGEAFYVQWRQRFSSSMINTVYKNSAGAGGWKTVIIGEGDRSGYNAGSCTKLEVVINNYAYRGFPRGYAGCGSWRNFDTRYGSFDFKLQNMVDNGAEAGAFQYCLYSTATKNAERPVPGCFPFVADNWMTFQVKIKVGNWSAANSEIEIWAGIQGQSSVHIIKRTDMIIDQQSANSKYGKVWFLPYNTSKDPSFSHEVGYTWYDDLIVSKSKIADPTDQINFVTPSTPKNVVLKRLVN